MIFDGCLFLGKIIARLKRRAIRDLKNGRQSEDVLAESETEPVNMEGL